MNVRDRLDNGQQDECARLGGGETGGFVYSDLVAVAAGAGDRIHARAAAIAR